MRQAHTVAQVRAAEAPLLAAGAPLMARASTALGVAVGRRLAAVYGARVVLLVGSGNNGADALYAGAWLARRGAAVVAVLSADPVQHALSAFLLAGGRVGTADALEGAEVVLDGLVGIGGSGPLRPPAAELVARVCGSLVVAVDMPSGVDADTGAVSEGAVRADLTVTFGTLKPGLLLARDHVGELELAEIGLDLPAADVEVLEAADVREKLRRPTSSDDKYRRGVVGVVAGSPAYSGAAVLTVGAALAAGAGMVRYVGQVEAVRVRWPEAVVSESLAGTGRVQAWVVGPGLGMDCLEVLADVLDRPEPVVVDADALTVCAAHPYLLQRREGATVVTPHDREYERFGSPVGADRVAAARGLAAQHQVTVLLKGDATVVATPEGRVRVNPTGSPYLASAGSGDVLAGAIGSLLAQGLDPLDAASAAAYVHGLTAERTRSSSGSLIAAWPDVVRGLEDDGVRSAARIDLGALAHNVGVLAERAPGAQVMAVVKADAYGHGLLPCARTAVEAGASWLGVAFLEEALALREAGLEAPVLAWLFAPEEDLVPAVAADVDLGVYSVPELARAAEAATAAGRRARLHLKADTGLSRGGATAADWPELCEAAAKAEADGTVSVVGVWSHLASSEQGPAHPTNREQCRVFAEAVEVAAAKGLATEVRHLANSGALLTDPATHFNLVRPGAALYGLAPVPGRRPEDDGLRPVMSLVSHVALTKRVPAGAGVSYGHRYTTERETTLALVPLGYGDGIPRAASNAAPVQLGDRRLVVCGTVAMDQLVVDVGDDEVAPGDEVVLFGPGGPTVQEWAEALGTIDYEVVTRIGQRVPRVLVGGQA